VSAEREKKDAEKADAESAKKDDDKVAGGKW
jgi:hypothetical protein